MKKPQQKQHRITRREFVKGAIALASIPGSTVLAQTTGTRLEWQTFRTTPAYQTFIAGIRALRTNTDPNPRNRWNYWVNAHVNFCPHSTAYFLAWHRGALYNFEQQLRAVTGDSTLMVPYWDYYRYPQMPAEFADRSSPLFAPNRVNTNVYNALGFNAFADTLTTFERGTTDSFERQVEGRPHNPVHNLIGGYMAQRTSPADPIFWLHHSNVDRLWVAWVAAGNGRQMPPSSSSYWSGVFTYGTGHTMARSQTMSNIGLGYRYQDETLPRTLPPRTQAGNIVRVQMRPGEGAPGRPPVRQFPVVPPRALGADRRSIGGVSDVTLDENSVSATVPVQAQDRNTIDVILKNLQTAPLGAGRRPQAPYRSIQVVLDNLRVTPQGRDGGYYYDIFLNLPSGGQPGAGAEQHFLGTVGPFEIDSAMHHGQTAQLSFPATLLLSRMTRSELKEVTLSFVRVNGPNYPRGPVITMGEARLELSPDDVE
ncbi:MAG TPA: tyrosinase family protein [Noviherbaspirillum sp.]